MVLGTCIGLGFFYGLLLQLYGQELVTLTPTGTLKIQRRVLGFEPVREYAAHSITNLRVSPLPQGFADFRVSQFRQGCFRRRARRSSSFDYGPIAFDYGAKTHRFGAGLDVAEAKIVVREIRRRYGL